ncbi:MAG TPA: indole-3-glycerol phosphate synthase TrpC [Desulforhopalus sp.]|nr:indole-3-glycerol phosphate synthase TrpC [Desulforhopalus sp.]
MSLERIIARKKVEVEELHRRGIVLPPAFQQLPVAPPRGFCRALLDYSGVAVIAEVKKASPSKGLICADFDPVAIAANYQQQGAQAVSVLTDVDFFQGCLEDLLAVRAAVSLPVLRKDFIIDPLQIEEARVHGADAVLLIAAILDHRQLEEYQAQAAALGMDSLVEVHDERETELAVAAGARLIGINNRNLRDFTIDLDTTFRLKKMIPTEIPVVSESGLRSAEDFHRLAVAGVAAALIGETLMRAGSASSLLRSIRAGGGVGR